MSAVATGNVPLKRQKRALHVLNEAHPSVREEDAFDKNEEVRILYLISVI